MNTNQRWIRITDCHNIPVREGRSVKVGGHDLAIFNLGDRFVAVENRCPHRGGPLADGILSGTTVVCPLHARKVNIETGTVVGPAATVGCVKTFDVRIQDGCVLLAIPMSARTRDERMPGSRKQPFSPRVPAEVLDLDDSTVGNLEV
jgi:nitrite reductase (NADH) small subunit